MSDDIAPVLIKRIEALEEQVAELRKPEPLVWPPIDLGMVAGTQTPADRMGFEPFELTERN